MKLSIVMPVYDEKATIEEIVRRVVAVDVGGQTKIVDLTQTTGGTRYNPDFAQAVARAGRRAGSLETLHFHRWMLGWHRVVNHPLNPRLFLELLLSYADLLRAAQREPSA